MRKESACCLLLASMTATLLSFANSAYVYATEVENSIVEIEHSEETDDTSESRVSLENAIKFNSKKRTIKVKVPENCTVRYSFLSDLDENVYMYNEESARTVKVDVGDGTTQSDIVKDRFTEDINSWNTYKEMINIEPYLTGENGTEVYLRVVLLNELGEQGNIETFTYSLEQESIEIETSIEYSKSYSKADVRVMATSSKGVNSISNVTTGEYKDGSDAYFEITENGNYTFCAKTDNYEKYIDVSVNCIQTETPSDEDTTEVIEKPSIEEDKNPPVLKIKGVSSKKNIESFTVTIHAEDKEGNLDYILLPDGRHIKEGVVEFIIAENGKWVFEACDKAGNKVTKSINVDNLGTESVNDSTDADIEDSIQSTNVDDSEVFGKLPQTGKKETKRVWVRRITMVLFSIVCSCEILRRKDKKRRAKQ